MRPSICWQGKGAVAVVTHGGVTIDLLRNLLTDQALPDGLLEAGIPSCAITSIDGLDVLSVAGTAHLNSMHVNTRRHHKQ